MFYVVYRVIALISVNIVPLQIGKDASLRVSIDIQTRDNIHRYQCDNPFII